MEIIFDSKDPKSILEYAMRLLDKRLIDVLGEEDLASLESASSKKRKGYLGDIVEEYFFHKKPDHLSQPDFPEAGVELKTTPIKRHAKKRYVAKERLVFQMIDYHAVINEKWEDSSFLKKNSLVLLMVYLYDKDKSLLDYRFKIVRLIDLLKSLPDKDIQIIRKDWETIVDKVKEGKAHEISEGDTYYLAACTKGSSAKDTTSQPKSEEKAMRRAFSFKPSYMNSIIAESLELKERYAESLFKKADRENIEDIVSRRFGPFEGLDVEEIAEKTGICIDMKRKDRYAILARAMLGIEKRKIKEFENADISMKIIRLEKNGMPKEAMSFPAIDYIRIVEEDWVESTLYRRLAEKKFLFVIFQYGDDSRLYFKKAKFWNMPYMDLEEARKVWEETVKRIASGRAGDLPKISESRVCHVRPHAKNSADTKQTPTGEYVVKKSFWLNSGYLREQAEKYLSHE